MRKLYTGPVTHDQLYVEAQFIQEILQDAGVRTISVCCAFGVDPEGPLFARNIPIEVAGLCEYFRHVEDAGHCRLGQANITLTYNDQGLAFFFGNDDDIFCEGEESPQLERVGQRWASRYPLSRFTDCPDQPEP